MADDQTTELVAVALLVSVALAYVWGYVNGRTKRPPTPKYRARITFMLTFNETKKWAIRLEVDQFDAAGTKVASKTLQGSDLKLEIIDGVGTFGTLSLNADKNEWVLEGGNISTGEAKGTITGTFSDASVNPAIVDQAIEGDGSFSWTAGDAVTEHGSLKISEFVE